MTSYIAYLCVYPTQRSDHADEHDCGTLHESRANAELHAARLRSEARAIYRSGSRGFGNVQIRHQPGDHMVDPGMLETEVRAIRRPRLVDAEED